MPGCRARLKRLENGETLEFLLLGPWEANVEQGIYNYKSPVGQALMGLRLGQQADINIGMLVGKFQVEAVTPNLH